MRDYYEILGVREDADTDTIRKAYRKRAMECHPDRNGSDAEMRLLNEALSVLTDPARRHQYDYDRIIQRMSDLRESETRKRQHSEQRWSEPRANPKPRERSEPTQQHSSSGNDDDWWYAQMMARRVGAATAKATIRVAAGSSGRCAAKAITRAPLPWLLVADGAQAATELALVHAGCDENTSATAGRVVGLAGTVGSCAFFGSVAGPAGAAVGGAVGLGYWVIGEVAGSIFTSIFGD